MSATPVSSPWTLYVALPRLRAAIERVWPGDALAWAETPDQADYVVLTPDHPRRLGALVDDMVARAAAARAWPTAPITLKAGVLHPRAKQWGRADGAMVPLTGREVELLLALHRASGCTLKKEAILREVWGYVPGLETHTLETHIYRLRQKIEVDPKNPQVLVTVANGYQLA